MTTKSSWLQAFAAAAALQGVAAFFWLATIPSEQQNAILWGFSGSRLMLLGTLGAVVIGSAALWARLRASIGFSTRMERILDLALADPGRARGLVVVSFLVLAAAAAMVLTPSALQAGLDAAISRLLPLIVLGGLLSLQWLLLLFRWLGGRLHWDRLAIWNDTIRPASLAGLVLLAAFAVVVATGIGLNPDRSGWYAPGTPLLATQVLLAASVTLVVRNVIKATGRRHPASEGPRRKLFDPDRLVGLALWLGAFLLWSWQPIESSSYFNAEPVPPNFESYPYSDSALYDGFAQHILLGSSRSAGLLLHTLYTFFLAFLHAIGGQDYGRLILLQVAALAVIPVFVFRIGARLGGRDAALFASLLVILRERNAIALTNVIEVSHSRLILSDVPTMALALGLVLLLLHWFSRRGRPAHWAALAGGLLGLLVLIRSQTLLLVPAVLLGIAVYDWPDLRRLARNSLVLSIGVALVIAPWIWRNHQVSGRFVVDNTEFYIRFLASSYHTPEQTIGAEPGETFDDYYTRMMRQIRAYVRDYPEEVMAFFASHFVHNEIEAILYLPMGPQLHNLESYLGAWPLWRRPRDPVPAAAVPWLAVNLAVIALGMGAATRRLKWVGLLPLFMQLAYSLSVVPARLSGWRFILPVDWVTMLYYSIGLFQAGSIAWSVLSGKAQPASTYGRETETVSLAPKLPPLVLSLAGLMFVGFLLPAVELGIPSRYPAIDALSKIDLRVPPVLQLGGNEVLLQSEVRLFVMQDPAARILFGRALYPGFYRRGKYWGDDTAFILSAREHARLQFTLAGSDRPQVYLPLQGPPAYFPHASEVLVVGCQEGGHVRGLLTYVIGQQAALSSAPWTGLRCDSGGPVPQ